MATEDEIVVDGGGSKFYVLVQTSFARVGVKHEPQEFYEVDEDGIARRVRNMGNKFPTFVTLHSHGCKLYAIGGINRPHGKFFHHQYSDEFWHMDFETCESVSDTDSNGNGNRDGIRTSLYSCKNTWTKGPSMLAARDNPNVVVVGDNLYLFGGRRDREIDDDAYVDDCPDNEVYNILSGQWSPLDLDFGEFIYCPDTGLIFHRDDEDIDYEKQVQSATLVYGLPSFNYDDDEESNSNNHDDPVIMLYLAMSGTLCSYRVSTSKLEVYDSHFGTDWDQPFLSSCGNEVLVTFDDLHRKMHGYFLPGKTWFTDISGFEDIKFPKRVDYTYQLFSLDNTGDKFCLLWTDKNDSKQFYYIKFSFTLQRFHRLSLIVKLEDGPNPKHFIIKEAVGFLSCLAINLVPKDKNHSLPHIHEQLFLDLKMATMTGSSDDQLESSSRERRQTLLEKSMWVKNDTESEDEMVDNSMIYYVRTDLRVASRPDEETPVELSIVETMLSDEKRPYENPLLLMRMRVNGTEFDRLRYNLRMLSEHRFINTTRVYKIESLPSDSPAIIVDCPQQSLYGWRKHWSDEGAYRSSSSAKLKSEMESAARTLLRGLCESLIDIHTKASYHGDVKNQTFIKDGKGFLYLMKKMDGEETPQFLCVQRNKDLVELAGVLMSLFVDTSVKGPRHRNQKGKATTSTTIVSVKLPADLENFHCRLLSYDTSSCTSLFVLRDPIYWTDDEKEMFLNKVHDFLYVDRKVHDYSYLNKWFDIGWIQNIPQTHNHLLRKVFDHNLGRYTCGADVIRFYRNSKEHYGETSKAMQMHALTWSAVRSKLEESLDVFNFVYLSLENLFACKLQCDSYRSMDQNVGAKLIRLVSGLKSRLNYGE